MRLAVNVATDYAESLLSTIATLRKALEDVREIASDSDTRGWLDFDRIFDIASAALDEKGGVMEKCGKVGERVVCVECGRTKKPIGRSAPMETYGGMCDFDLCAGYNLAPFPSDLWPGEVCEMVHPTPAKEGEGA